MFGEQAWRLRLPIGSVITITIMVTQFCKVTECDYDYMTNVIDYNYDYNETKKTSLHLIMLNIVNVNIFLFSVLPQSFENQWACEL